MAPDFFQQDTPDALADQAKWIVDELGVSRSSLARVMRIEVDQVTSLLRDGATLSSRNKEEFQALWSLVLHLLSFQNLDTQRVRHMLDAEVGSAPSKVPYKAPWAGSTIRAYLEQEGSQGVGEVDKWVTAFRFRDLYASS